MQQKLELYSMRRSILKVGSEQGLSILGLMVALMLSALILTISLPSLGDFRSETRLLKREARHIQTLLEDLSLKAALSGGAARFSFDQSSYQASLLLSGEEILIEGRKLKPGLSFEMPTATAQELNFYASGVSSPATLKIKSTAKFCLLKLSLRARVNLIC